MYYIELWALFMSQHFKIMLEYRVSFIIGVLSSVVQQTVVLLALWVVMQQIPHLNGWELDEIFLIYGFLTVALSLNRLLADNLWSLGWKYIRSGEFDRYLLRPLNPLFFFLSDYFCKEGFGDLLVGLFLIVKASIALGIAWTPLNILYTIIMIASGGMIFIAVNLITASASFWMTDSLPLTASVWQTNEFAKYPLDIYNSLIRKVFTWIIPYGLVSFYPASYLLGKDAGGLVLALPLMAVALSLIAYSIWQVGLNQYTSTGT